MIKLKKTLKILLCIVLFPVLIFFLFVGYVAYDWRISEAGRLSGKFNKKIEQFIQEKRTSFELKELTDFEWDEVCFESGDGQYIDLESQYLIDHIGFKPKFLFRSKYWIDYDLSGLLFIDRKNKKVYVMHQIYMIDDVKASNKKISYKDSDVYSGYHGTPNLYYRGCYDSNEHLSFSIPISNKQKIPLPIKAINL